MVGGSSNLGPGVGLLDVSCRSGSTHELASMFRQCAVLDEGVAVQISCHLVRVRARAGVKLRVGVRARMKVGGRLPPQAGRQLILGEVERYLAAQRPVEL